MVSFSGWHSLTVHGVLEAVGTAQSPITFTAAGEAGWLGLRFIDGQDGSALAHCIVQNGKASAGTPHDRGGGVYSENSSPLITDSIIRHNQAASYGGGIYCEGGAPVISRSLIINNVVGYGTLGYGGGVYCKNTTVELSGNVIQHNLVSVFGGPVAAYGGGGGVYLQDGEALFVGNIIAGNAVEAQGKGENNSQGGGIHARGSIVQIIQSTISANAASPGQGGGISLSRSSGEIVSTIIEGNEGGGVQYDASSEVRISYSALFGNDGADLTGNDLPPGLGSQLNNIFLDPQLINPMADDYRLRSGSPAINTGDPTLPLDPDGTLADMGALAFQSKPTLALRAQTASSTVVNRGGAFSFSLILSNPLEAPQTVDLWAGFVLPGGGYMPLSPMVRAAAVGPGASLTYEGLRQAVAEGMGPGEHTYIIYAGRFPGQVVEAASFGVTVR